MENKCFSYTFALKTNNDQNMKINRMFKAAYNAYVDGTKYYQKRLRSYRNDKRYKAYLNERYEAAKVFAIENVGERPADEDEAKTYDKKFNNEVSNWYSKNKINEQQKQLLRELQVEYDLSGGTYGSNSLRKKLLHQYTEYLDDNMVTAIVKNINAGAKKVLFSNGESIKIKPGRKFTTICLTRNRDGYIYVKDGKFYFQIKQARKKGKVRMNVEIITDNVAPVVRQALEHNEIKYGTLKRVQTIDGWKYQIQILFDGELNRLNLEKNIGKVGVDVTERHIAVVTKDKTYYFETPAKDEAITTKINNIQVEMDNVLRRDNPEHFNEDGTFKRGVKGRLNKSYEYRKLRRTLQVLYAKQTNKLAYQQNVLANAIVSLGNEITIVQKDWHEKVKRATETTRDEKGAYEDKSSLSEESVRMTSPAQLISKIKQRAEYINADVNAVSDKKFDIYNIDIFTGEKMPYSIEDEFYCINGYTVQRSKYYAFIVSGYDSKTESIDYDYLQNNFEQFVKSVYN